MENHHAINGKINSFDWAIFNSYMGLSENVGYIPNEIAI